MYSFLVQLHTDVVHSIVIESHAQIQLLHFLNEPRNYVYAIDIILTGKPKCPCVWTGRFQKYTTY